LPAVAALKAVLAQLEAAQVDRARRLGWSWQEIADRLGVTKQTVHRKYAAQDALPTALRARH
jgi:IS30 family transposase